MRAPGRIVIFRPLVVLMLVASCRFDLPSGTPVDAGGDAGGDAVPPNDGNGPTAWLQPWMYRKAITLRASQIEAPGDGALTNFPVLVSVTDADISAGALPTGADIVFTTDDATTVLASELELFAAATGELIAWVKVPSLSATTDTTLYVYYGNPNPPAQTPEAVWAPDHLAVWHLHQDPDPGGAGDIRDATSGDHDGTAQNLDLVDRMRAQVGLGFAFDGTSEYLDFGAMSFGNAFTISMWVNFAGGTNPKTLMANSNTGADTNGFRFFINTIVSSDRKVMFETGNGANGSTNRAETSTNAIALNVFTHVAAVVNRTAGTASIYVNGTRADTDSSIRNDFAVNSDFEVGRMEDNVLFFGGILDEIQVATTLRPAEWLRTSFNNQSQPATFHTLGPEELRP